MRKKTMPVAEKRKWAKLAEAELLRRGAVLEEQQNTPSHGKEFILQTPLGPMDVTVYPEDESPQQSPWLPCCYRGKPEDIDRWAGRHVHHKDNLHLFDSLTAEDGMRAVVQHLDALDRPPLTRAWRDDQLAIALRAARWLGWVLEQDSKSPERRVRNAGTWRLVEGKVSPGTVCCDRSEDRCDGPWWCHTVGLSFFYYCEVHALYRKDKQ